MVSVQKVDYFPRSYKPVTGFGKLVPLPANTIFSKQLHPTPAFSGVFALPTKKKPSLGFFSAMGVALSILTTSWVLPAWAKGTAGTSGADSTAQAKKIHIQRMDKCPALQALIRQTCDNDGRVVSRVTMPVPPDKTMGLNDLKALESEFNKEIYRYLMKATAFILVMPVDKPDAGFLSSGSGFVIRKNGTLMTNYHVIKSYLADPDRRDIKIILPDQQELFAKVKTYDRKADLAVLEILPPQEGLTYLPDFSTLQGEERVEKVRVGESLYSVGHPGATFPWTFATGELTGVNRTVAIPFQDPPADTTCGDVPLIQHNLVSVKGVSGSPITNAEGRVVGVNVAYMNEANENIGFAIPFSWVAELMYVTDRLTDIEDRPVDVSLYRGMNLETDACGIWQFNAKKKVIESEFQRNLAEIKQKKAAGDTTGCAPLLERNNALVKQGTAMNTALNSAGLNKHLQTGLLEGGILLFNLKPNGLAARSGLMEGDVIVGLDGNALTHLSAESFHRYFKTAFRFFPMELEVFRGGQRVKIVLSSETLSHTTASQSIGPIGR